MNFFFTTNVWIDLKDQAVAGCVKLREFFSLHPISGSSYGSLDQVSFMIVSVYADEADNIRECAGAAKKGSYKDFLTGEKVRFVRVGVCVPPSELEGVDAAGFMRVFAKHIPEALEAASPRFPKKFEFEKFNSEMNSAIEDFNIHMKF